MPNKPGTTASIGRSAPPTTSGADATTGFDGTTPTVADVRSAATSAVGVTTPPGVDVHSAATNAIRGTTTQRLSPGSDQTTSQVSSDPWNSPQTIANGVTTGAAGPSVPTKDAGITVTSATGESATVASTNGVASKRPKNNTKEYDYEYYFEDEYNPNEFGGGAIDTNFKRSMRFNEIIGDIDRLVQNWISYISYFIYYLDIILILIIFLIIYSIQFNIF